MAWIIEPRGARGTGFTWRLPATDGHRTLRGVLLHPAPGSTWHQPRTRLSRMRLALMRFGNLGGLARTFDPLHDKAVQMRTWVVTAFLMPRPAATPKDPWVRRHPGLVLAAAGVLYAAVLALRMLDGTPVEAYSMLYALPVALVATTFGLRLGTVAGLVAVALLVLWVVVQDVDLSPAGLASRVVPLLLLGVLLGHARDRGRRAEFEHRRLEVAELLQREAVEISDSLLQGMAAARWSLENDRVDTGKEILDQTIVQAQDLVSELIERAGMSTHTEPLSAHVEPARDHQSRPVTGPHD